MSKSPAFQFYPSDFLSDENVILMSNQAVGCYIKLLCICWKEGSIPSDLPRITRLCNETPENMAEVWPSLAPCFKQNSHGRMTNPRLEREWLKQQGFRKERSESGKRGAEERWKNRPLNSSAIAKPMAKPMANDSSSSSSSSSYKEIKKEKVAISLPEWIEPDLWNDFKEHRKKLRKPMTLKAEKIIIKKLEYLKDQGHNPRHLLITAIERGWQSVFAPKEI